MKYAGIFIPLVSVAGLTLLSGCNTVEGVGRDLQRAGEARHVRAHVGIQALGVEPMALLYRHGADEFVVHDLTLATQERRAYHREFDSANAASGLQSPLIDAQDAPCKSSKTKWR